MSQISPPSIAGFQYVRPLGKGGFARVYLYEQDMPRRMVAVKALQKSVGEMRHAFETEADMMAALSSHPAVVAIYEASISADGQPYLVMEFCPDSLGARAKQAPLPLREVLEAGVRLAGGLETAHRSGVLHRDIKPSNVLQTVTGKPALTDFGIADLIDRDTSAQSEMAMSIPWSAPEVVAKAETGSVASEIWALGATLYTFASGRSPFANRVAGAKDVPAALVKEITKAKYVPIEGAVGYEAFDEVLAKAMAKQPGDRFASMAEFGRALQDLQRAYCYDVTPLEVIDRAWIAPAGAAPDATHSRGPKVTTVGRVSRAEQRERLGSTPEVRAPQRTSDTPAARRPRSTASIVTITVVATLVAVVVGAFLASRLGLL